MRTLTLTSPLTRGPDVGRAQGLLRANGYFVGAQDSVFGEITGRACSEAKYKLGYSLSNVKPTYGSTLAGYLSGRKRPSVLMSVRSRRRAQNTPLGITAIKVAREYIGLKESPAGSNRILFAEWYGIIGPWCAMFLAYIFVKAGSKAFVKGSYWAYVPFMLADARAQRNGLITIDKSEVVGGDIAPYSFKRDGFPVHVGLVLTRPDANGNFTAVEGNTSVSNDSDGGEVAVRSRNVLDVVEFIRVIK